MVEYSYDSVIIDPNKEGIESLIGKEVYFSDIPHVCLENANLNDFHYLGILEQIRKDGNAPFKVKGTLSTTYWSCIIIKKGEQSLEYIPFESGEEFLDAYYHNEVKNLDGIYHHLSSHGIWLEGKGKDVHYMVTEIWDDGVVIGDDKMMTTRVASDKYFTINGTTTWSELFENYTFLGGSPCGKEKK